VHEWSFAQLQWMIRYKAARAGVEVVYIDPRYTSQTCSRCLHLGVRPSQSNFQCRDCGYQINADLNGAKSVAARHDLVAMGRYFCEYPRKEVNRPEAVRSSDKEASSTKPETASSIYSASSRLDGVVDSSFSSDWNGPKNPPQRFFLPFVRRRAMRQTGPPLSRGVPKFPEIFSSVRP
ncbi:MAG TPA: transposase, partial [Blastocatellia bacterium]